MSIFDDEEDEDDRDKLFLETMQDIMQALDVTEPSNEALARCFASLLRFGRVVELVILYKERHPEPPC